MSTAYAIVESGGKQYRVEKGTSLLVDRLRAGEGEKVQLRPVAFRDGDRLAASADELAKVKVEAVVAGELRGEKIRVFKYKAKKGYRRRAGHRSELTRLEVTNVAMAGGKAATKKPAEKKGPAEEKAAKAEPAEKKAAEKKPAARKPAAKKAESKTAAKKPATKKGSAGAKKKPEASKDKKEEKES